MAVLLAWLRIEAAVDKTYSQARQADCGGAKHKNLAEGRPALSYDGYYVLHVLGRRNGRCGSGLKATTSSTSSGAAGAARSTSRASTAWTASSSSRSSISARRLTTASCARPKRMPTRWACTSKPASG